MDDELVRLVRLRADGACEYCLMSQEFYPTVPFPIDHIIARQHSGRTVLSNLALACLHCNCHKGPNISGLDPKTGRLTKLFNPRRHKWERHFAWEGSLLVGKTNIGRTTVAVLALNDSDLITVREELIVEGRFPPTKKDHRRFRIIKEEGDSS